MPQCVNRLMTAVVLLLGGQPLIASEVADSVFINGRIYTVEEDRPWAEAVAIKRGRFIAVGTNEEVRRLIGGSTLVRNLNGKMAMPGMHDGHVHFVESGYKNLYECELPRFTTLEEVAGQLKACRPKIRGNPAWLVVYVDFIPPLIEGFDKKFLDTVFPDVAVYVREFTYHNAVVNSRALRLAGIDKNTPDPKGGRIVRDPVTGDATGLLIDLAVNSVLDSMPAYSIKEQDEATHFISNLYARFGITSFQAAGIAATELDALRRADQAGKLNQHVSAHLLWGQNVIAKADPSLIEGRQQYTSDLVRVDAVKAFLDGVPIPPYFTHAPLHESGAVDRTNLLVFEEVLSRQLIEWDGAGLRVKIHVAGEGAARIALNSIEKARLKNGDLGLIHELAHAGSISPADIKRLKPLNVAAEMSPGYGGLVDPGDPAMANLWQFKTLMDNGAILTAGSDYPVIPTPNPMPWLQGIVSRPGESIDLESAIRMLTRNGAKVIGRESDFGSIEQGKVANMIVLNQNLFEIPVTDIAKTQVIETLFRGETVYEAVP